MMKFGMLEQWTHKQKITLCDEDCTAFWSIIVYSKQKAKYNVSFYKMTPQLEEILHHVYES